MSVGWVLPGGASLGAIQVGQMEALVAVGIVPDLIVGTSAGSLNAAWIAASPSAAGVASLRGLWLGADRGRIFPLAPLTAILGFAGRRDHVVDTGAFRRWLEESLPYRRIEDAQVPLTITATDLADGRAVLLRQGELVPALLASCAVPGCFAPVAIDGRLLIDGGMAADAPIGALAEAGADEIYVFPTLGPIGQGRPRSPGDVVMRTVGLMLGNSRRLEIEAWAGRRRVFVAPVPDTSGVSPMSFKHSRALMDSACELTAAWLPTARPVEPGG